MPHPFADYALQLHPRDGVAVALRALPRGLELVGSPHPLVIAQPIPAGHKVALDDLPAGSAVRKYGQPIGIATTLIPAGTHVHTHNLALSDLPPDDDASAARKPQAVAPRTFLGFDRGDGRIGTRNTVAIISTVNCSAGTSKRIAARVRSSGLLERYPNVDAVIPIVHKGGCGLQHGGPDHTQLNRTLAGFARHPNVAACVVVGLGCETGQAGDLVVGERLGAIPVLTVQESGGIARTVEAGFQVVAELLPGVDGARRTPQPASKLVLGTNCGGSDGLSGVTANPALGVAADWLVAQGGTVILGETPELFGAEHLLVRRAISREVGEKLLERLRWWREYAAKFGASLDNNPSVGNKAGGLTTIAEKSLGAVAKGGTTALRDVIAYAARPTGAGLIVMDTPGYDPASMTGIVAGGATVAVFTTGRGSVFGLQPTPTLRVSTNTPLYERMSDDMDLDAGTMLTGESLESMGQRIIEAILATASGQQTKGEALGVGEDEFVPWSIGPTL